MAADRGVHLDRLDGARFVRRHRPAQFQAHDGLFIDRPHGLRAGGARRRHDRRRAGRDPLSRHLHRDDVRRVHADPGDEAQRSRD